MHIMLVLIGFSEMRVFAQLSLFNTQQTKIKEKEATWASPMCQKQWKSLYEIDILTFGVQTRVFNFLGKYKERLFSKSIWIDPCEGFTDLFELQQNL